MADDTLDASKFRPMNIQSTVLLCNQMVVQTTSFLNEFSQTVERKISKVSSKVTQLEILLAVLEAKINSVAAIEEEPVPAPSPAPATVPEGAPAVAPASSSGGVDSDAAAVRPPPPPPPPTGDGAPHPAAAAAAEPEPEPEVTTPTGPPTHFSKYQKMQKMGLPEGAVRMKMAQEGVSDDDAEAFLSGNFSAIKSQPPPAIEG